MIFAFVFTVFVGVCAVALIGLEDSHHRVTRLLEELDQKPAEQNTAEQTRVVAPMVTAQQGDDAFGELAFTRSLLALSKAGSLIPCDSPAPVPDESSSLALIRPHRSKNRVQEL